MPFQESRYDLVQFSKLRIDTNRVHKFQDNGGKPTQTVTKKFILDGSKSCLLCRRGYGGADKEIESRLREIETQLKAVLEPHLKRGTR